MYFIDKLKEFDDKKVNIYVDMDGCLADYLIIDKNDIKNNVRGAFIDKRPMYTSINFLKKINEMKNVTLYILSACYFKEQVDEKNIWLNKYAPFFNTNNRYILAKHEYNNMDTKKLKVDFLKEIINENEINFIIEDDHSNIKEFKKEFPNLYVFHISSIIK